MAAAAPAARSRRARGTMPLRQHLAELRRRLIWAVVGVAAGTVVGWFCYPPVFQALQDPIVRAAEVSGSSIMLNFATVAASLDMRLRVCLFIGIVVSSPWWLYQIWAFIAPGLTRRERRYTAAYLGAAIPLFAGGVWLAAFMLPQVIAVLTSFTPAEAANLIDAQTYLGFVMRLALAFGISFEVPVFMVALSALGIVAPRTWLRAWRWAVLLAAVFGAVATPTGDIFSMSALAAPVILLYFGAAGITILLTRSRARREGREALRQE